MSDAMISREDADVLSRRIHALIDQLDSSGFSRAAIGSAMSGIGLALVQVHVGHQDAMRMVAGLESLLTGDDGKFQ